MQSTYKLIDSGDQMKLEQIGDYVIARPSPYAVWPKSMPVEWEKCNAEYIRYAGGSGEWKFKNGYVQPEFVINVGNILFNVRFTSFGHLGVFCEQKENWDWMQKKLEEGGLGRQPEVLNLFAYTGGSSLACAKAGARVTHVDAVKSVVDWAHKNAITNEISQDRIRWIVDDAVKFARREVTRGKKYDAIILDPPSHGRGPKGETFVIEEQIIDLLQNLKKLLSNEFLFLNYTCHTPGFTPTTLSNQIKAIFGDQIHIESKEVFIKEESGRYLPTGMICTAT